MDEKLTWEKVDVDDVVDLVELINVSVEIDDVV